MERIRGHGKRLVKMFVVNLIRFSSLHFMEKVEKIHVFIQLPLLLIHYNIVECVTCVNNTRLLLLNT